ncbi:Ger(x)C family spore germination protein [Neobacillus sp. CF12]|uniref:Ger(x)C family spore germination protein n=1 Tax=Neobacillus sp. CF12 TaxID=3055864 RepID=UPI0025A0B538|nr:Ger(x)C family spore germination protein [Neobacillus sp. CF12]MDM5329959.1 Ger(x)C family spore germination protein [Neobacillus sp. CF12]
MRNFIYIIWIFSVLTGCAKIHEIQFQAYAVGIGIDYQNDEYHVVLQFLDFSNVAKTEQGKSDQPSPVWLGEGRGKTVEDAIIKIYHGIQIPVNYDQLSVFIFGKSVLENRLKKTVEALDTNFNIRLTGWVYGTEEPVEKIFTTKVPFNYAYTNARIVQPQYMQQQDSSIPALSLQGLVYQLHEKSKTILVPSISTEVEIMTMDQDKLPVTVFNGAYLMKGEKLKGHLTEEDLAGFIRVNNKSIRSPVIVRGGKEEIVQIELLNPKMKRMVNKDQNGMQIGLEIKISAIVRESSKEILAPTIKRKLKEQIRKEVYDAYLKSQKVGGDIYQFEDYMYRFMHDDWKSLQTSGKFPTLNKKDIHVEIAPLKSINRINAGVDTLLNNGK